MNNQEVANFIREKYGRLDYLLLTLVSCSLLMSQHVTEESDPALQIVKETLDLLRNDLTPDETATIATLMAEIDYLKAIDSPDES